MMSFKGCVEIVSRIEVYIYKMGNYQYAAI